MDRRVIALIDVERHKNPALVDKPLILCQHGSKTGLALSISYEAREFGVKRGMKIKESKDKCPELEVVFVPPMENLDKGDLSCYKEASDSIFDVMLSFCGPNVIVEKASVDEAFLDLTKEIDSILRDEKFQSFLKNPDEKLEEYFPSTYAYSPSHDPKSEKQERLEILKQYIDKCASNKENLALLAGTYFMEQLRKEIFERTNYHCSAGIASNKMLAKLIASRHKPKSQTVLPMNEAESYLAPMSIQSVRWYGGKFGKKICELLKITNIGEIASVPIDRLSRTFPEDYLRIINLSKGVCSEPVVQRIMPKSISVAKILYGVEGEQIMVWAKGLAVELLKRLEIDQEKFSRSAQHMEIGVSFVSGPRFQKSASIPCYKIEPIQKLIKQFFANHYGTSDELKWSPGAKYISIHATKFGPSQKNLLTLDSFLKPKVEDDFDSNDICIIEEQSTEQSKSNANDLEVPAKSNANDSKVLAKESKSSAKLPAKQANKSTAKNGRKRDAKSTPLVDNKQMKLNFGVPARRLNNPKDNVTIDLCDSD